MSEGWGEGRKVTLRLRGLAQIAADRDEVRDLETLAPPRAPLSVCDPETSVPPRKVAG